MGTVAVPETGCLSSTRPPKFSIRENAGLNPSQSSADRSHTRQGLPIKSPATGTQFTVAPPQVGAAPSAIENSQNISISLHDSRPYLPNNHSSYLSVLGDHNLNRNRTSLRYPGGKARLSRTFVPYFPQIGGTFCDVFAGRGNVFFAAASTLQYGSWWINDIRTIPWFTNMLMCGDSVGVPFRRPILTGFGCGRGF